MQDTRLAAIMFTDIAGYSRLMEEDEVRTIELLHKHNEIVFPLIEKASGTIVDAIGDGLLITFPSVLVAVRSAIEIQEVIDQYNQAVPRPQQFRLRIGVHLGEIWEEGDRVFGNGVNVAARIQPFAVPGGICISEDVHRQISNKISVPFLSIGPRDLKNISRQIELYRVVTGPPSEDVDMSDPSVGSGSLDEAKERLLQERAKIAARRERGESRESALGQAIENRVFNLVERAMDVAIDKWEHLPEEKRREALKHGQWKSHQGTSVVLDGGDVRGATAHRAHRGVEDSHKPGGDLSAGAVFGVGFGVGYFAFGIGWMIWPFLLLGVLPVVSGLRKVLQNWLKQRAAQQRRPQLLEREVLEAAKRLGGRVTVVQISSETDLSLDEGQATLERMAAKGYVSQNVTDTGVVEFEFPALVSPDAE